MPRPRIPLVDKPAVILVPRAMEMIAEMKGRRGDVILHGPIAVAGGSAAAPGDSARVRRVHLGP